MKYKNISAVAAAMAIIGGMSLDFSDRPRSPEPESREHKEYRAERRKKIKAQRKARKKNK